MDDETIRALNAINRRFYETVAADFDATRQTAWQGWERLLPFLKPSLAVLDAGCGNGRFGVFLAQRLGKQHLRYIGIDQNAALLDRARQSLTGIDAQFEQRDLVEQPSGDSLGAFDLVALFGVLHHVPGAERRLALLRSLADRVAPGGLLAFTEWRFMAAGVADRFRARIVPWDAVLWGGGGGAVEAGDYLLDWRRGVQAGTAPALRYCHYVDDAEHVRLVAAAGLNPIAEYRADAANLYTILRRAE